jgi:hypothetical protein
LIAGSDILTASRILVPGDLLASRLQGQSVDRSAFVDVVKAELGWDDKAACAPLPAEAKTPIL